MQSRVDHGNVPAALASDVSTRAAREKCDRARPPTGVDLREDALFVGRNREHFAFFFARHIHFTIHRIHAHAFRFLRYLHLPARLPRAEIDNRRARIILVRDERKFSVFADRKLLRIGADMPAVDQLARVGIDHTEAIRRLV